MAAQKGKAQVERVLAGARERRSGRRTGRGHRTQLFAWLWKHHDRLAEERARGDAPTWDEVAAELCRLAQDEAEKAEVLDGNGELPTGLAVQRTWSKVRVAKAAEATQAARMPAPLPVLPRPQVSAINSAITTAELEEEVKPVAPIFGFAKARG